MPGSTMRASWLVEICRRSQSGPYMKEGDFDLKLTQRASELVREYEVKFDRNQPVPADDALADRLYEAGMQLFLDVGVYNQSTERCIMFTREEVENAVANAPSELVLGQGRDARVMRHRTIGDTSPPIVFSGPTGTPCSERYHPGILLSCAQEPLVDCLGAGSVSTYLGEKIVPGTPLEILGARRDAVVAREAVRMAGRPGMHISDVAVPLTCEGKMAAMSPENGLRPTDAFLVSQMVELKTDFDQLSRVAHMLNEGINIVDLMTPLIGGMGGGAQGTAVVTVACHLLGVICYGASYHFMSHTHIKYVNNTDRMGLWMQAVVGQALARNTPILAVNDIYVVSGPGTRELLFEVAAGAMIGATCGMHEQGAGCTGGFNTDHYTGLEARFIAEVARASLGMDRRDVNALVLELLKGYERTLNEPNRGYPFPQVYDPETVQPRDTWLEIYHEVKEEISKLGLQFQFH